MVSEGESSSENTSAFYLFITKQKVANTIFLSIRSRNQGIDLPESILLVEAWARKAREHVQKPVDDLHFFNPDEFKKK